MKFFTNQDVENYLQNKQVYFKKEICCSDFKTIAESGKVHNIGKVELTLLNENTIAFHLNINGIDVTIYEYKSDVEFFAWVRTNFIPVLVLVEQWNGFNRTQATNKIKTIYKRQGTTEGYDEDGNEYYIKTVTNE